MRRFCLALALLLGGVVSTATADYVLIIANLAHLDSRNKPGATAATPPGAPPAQPAVGQPPSGAQFGIPIGQPGAPSLVGNPLLGMPGQAQATEFDPDKVPMMILAVIELEKRLTARDVLLISAGQPINAGIIPTKFHVNGQDGKIVLANTAISKVVPLHPDNKATKTLKEVYDENLKKLSESQPPATVEQWVEFAEWCFGHAMLDHFKQHMEKAASIDKSNAKIASYLQMKAALAKPVEKVDVAGPWRKALLSTAYQVTPSAHYALLHSKTIPTTQVDARLRRLEDSLQAFYYWFALHGVMLPVPSRPQAAILTIDAKDFKHLHNVLESSPVVTDSFYARRENIAVFSAKPLEDAYDRLDKMSQPLRSQGFNFDEILKSANKGFPRTSTPRDRLDAMTIALLQRVLEANAEVSGTGYGATRQLLCSSGLLAGSVATPEWIQFGVSSFFTSSPGSPWPTCGTPNFEYSPMYRDLDKFKRLPPDKLELLHQIVTDDFFRNPKQGLSKEAAARKARATAWCLTYFLTRKHLDGLQRYFKELSQLPRDLALDEGTLWLVFARSFNALDASGQPDLNALRELVDEWDRDIIAEKNDPREIALMLEISSAFKLAVITPWTPPVAAGPAPVATGGQPGVGAIPPAGVGPRGGPGGGPAGRIRPGAN
jgi:hypothetical protein